MANRIQLRRGTATEWATANPVLAQGEPGIETDTGKQKFGDGATPWSSLTYASQGPIGPAGPVDDNGVRAVVGNPATATSKTLAANYATAGRVFDTDRIKAKISGYGTKTFIRRLSATYEFGYQIDDKRYMTHSLGTLSTAPGGYTNLYQLQDAYVRHPLQGHQETEITLTGTWVASTSGTVYGGSAQRSNTAGDTAVFTVPSGSDDIGLIASSLTNAGAAKVTIVDSAGAAIDAAMLPTAQQQVDGGLLPSTVLVANGGTLNPTDRVLNLYSTAGIYADSTWMLAQGLNQSRTHTVTVTVTGYKHASATDSRVYVSGFCHSGPGASLVPEKAWSWVNVQKMSPNAASAWEYAVAMNLDGVDVTMGNVHGYDNQTALTIVVDGAARTLAVGDAVAGRSIVIDRTSELYHTSSVPKAADVLTRYNIAAPDGMRVQTKITFRLVGLIRYAMQGMWPYSAVFTRATWAGSLVDYNATDANNSEKGHVPLFTFAAWHPTGDYAGFIGINPEGVANWANSPVSGSYLQDRDTDMKKLYFPWNLSGSGGDPTYTTTVGEVWTKEAHYRVARVPGADKVMSRL